MDLYREQLLEHYHHPYGWGLVASANISGQGFNPVCGDRIAVQLVTHDDTIASMHFEAEGCVISRAAASLLSEALAGKKVSLVAQLTLASVEQLMGSQVPADRVAIMREGKIVKEGAAEVLQQIEQGGYQNF